MDKNEKNTLISNYFMIQYIETLLIYQSNLVKNKGINYHPIAIFILKILGHNEFEYVVFFHIFRGYFLKICECCCRTLIEGENFLILPFFSLR